MKLTGKAKEDFEKWFKTIKHNNLHVMNIDDVIGFGILPDSMQYGVLVDWFDSVGIRIEILAEPYDFGIQIFKKDKKHPIYSVGSWETRPQARLKAIEKANEIYNKL